MKLVPYIFHLEAQKWFEGEGEKTDELQATSKIEGEGDGEEYGLEGEIPALQNISMIQYFSMKVIINLVLFNTNLGTANFI